MIESQFNFLEDYRYDLNRSSLSLLSNIKSWIFHSAKLFSKWFKLFLNFSYSNLQAMKGFFQMIYSLQITFLLFHWPKANRINYVVNNPLPFDGVYAKAIEKDYAEAITSGKGRLARPGIDEGWITAAADLKGFKRSELAARLSLYTDKGGTKLKNTDNYVVIEFKLNDPTGLGISSPFDPVGNQRYFGWIPGGRTKGGSREWLINADAPNNGIIDLATVRIVELEP